MHKSIKYELKFKIASYQWRTFDTYTDKEDPDIKKYANLLSKSEFNNGVKLIEVKTTRTEVDI